MADIRINQLPTAASPVPTLNVAVDGAATEKVTIQTLVDTGRPLASQAEAEAGTNPSKAMTPLTTKQAIVAQVSTAGMSGDYNDLGNLPTLGNASGLNVGTTAGTVAAGDDTRIVNSLQTAAIGSTVQAYSANLDTLAGVAPGAAGLGVLGSPAIPDVLDYLGVAPSYGRYKLEQYVPIPQAINATNLGAAMQNALDDRATGGTMVGKPLYVPAQPIDQVDTWVFPAGIHIIWGGRHPSFKRYGDTTGGDPHPYAGTVVSTRGAGTARVWTDIDAGGDAPMKPAFVLLGESGTFEGGLTLLTGQDGAGTCWDTGLHRMSSNWSIYNVEVRGYTSVLTWQIAADYWDATHSNLNTTDPMLSNGKIPSWFDITVSDYGLTNNNSYNCVFRGVRAVCIRGTTRPGQVGWKWAPNGISDSNMFAPAFYAEGTDLQRQTVGATFEANYRLADDAGNLVAAQGMGIIGVNGDPDCLWAFNLDYFRKLTIVGGRNFFETSTAWQNTQIADGKPVQEQRARINRTVNTGVIVVMGEFNCNLALNGDAGNTPLKDHRYRNQGGDQIWYFGTSEGAISIPGLWEPGPSGSGAKEIGSFFTNGQVNFIDQSGGGIDTHTRIRKRAAGKGEQTFDNVSWFSYEEGTWTPTLRGATTAGTNAYTAQTGTWTRTGRVVRVSALLQINGAVDATMAGQMQIAGLPFTSRNSAANVAGMVVADIANANLTANANLAGYIAPNTSVIALSERSGNDISIIATTKFNSNFRVRFSANYEIA